MVEWSTVRGFAGELPAAEESTTYGQPCFKVRGKLFAWLSPDRAAAGALALRIDPGELPLLLETAPDRYFQTPHYHGHPIVLVHLDRIEPDELRERIEDSWALRAPKRLLDERRALLDG
jgi:hypothetical protein